MAYLNTTTKTNLDSAVPEMWAPGLVADACKKSFWNHLRSSKTRDFTPILEKTDFAKGRGDVIHFQTVSQIYSRGVTGNSTLKGNETKMVIGTYQLTVDWLRNAMAWDDQGDLDVNFSIVQTVRELLSDWMSRRLDDDLMLALLDVGTLGTYLDTMYAGDATGMSDLAAGDELDLSAIELVRLALLRKGARPIGMENVDGRQVPLFGLSIDEISEYRLSQDTTFDQAQYYAAERGKTNPIFTNALYFIRGMILYPYYSVHSDCVQGTPLRPEAVLSTGINDSATTFLFGGASDKKDYLQNFDDTSGADANYLMIEDEIITYDGDNISEDAQGCRYAITGGITRGAGGSTAAAHDAGCLVTQKRAARLVGFGAHIGLRGWGMKPTPITEDEDYQFEHGLGLKAIFGQAACRRRDLKVPNYVVLTVYAHNPLDGSKI